MDDIEQAKRDEVVREAKSWLGTPYHHQAFVKGAGVDCGFLLICIYHACGLIDWIDPRPYPHDWHLHRSAEMYLGWVERYAMKVDRAPKAGDIVLFKFGRCISHGGIMLNDHDIIHAYIGLGVVIGDINKEPLRGRYAGVYSIWG